MTMLAQFDESMFQKLEAASRRVLNSYQRDLSHIGKGRDHWAERGANSWGEWVAKVLQHQLDSPFAVVPPGAISQVFGGALSDRLVFAKVVHNRWIAECECGGAEAVDPEAPLFYCFSCYNLESGGLPRTIAFPVDWEEIESVLLARPDPLARNALPTESVTMLKQENQEHGLLSKRGT